MIIRTDLLRILGINLNFDDLMMTWGHREVPMKTRDATRETAYHVKDKGKAASEATDRIKRILDAKYEPANLEEVAAANSDLTQVEQQKLLNLLRKHKVLFDGTIGKWNGPKYNVELKPDATPHHARAYPIPKVHEKTLKMECDRLCAAGVLREINDSEWAAPCFIIPKKDGTVRFISDFRKLNKRIRRTPYPIPKIQDLLLKLEGFKYGTSLDLNMGYYHIELTPSSRRLCTIVLPWGKYEYNRAESPASWSEFYVIVTHIQIKRCTIFKPF